MRRKSTCNSDGSKLYDMNRMFGISSRRRLRTNHAPIPARWSSAGAVVFILLFVAAIAAIGLKGKTDVLKWLPFRFSDADRVAEVTVAPGLTPKIEPATGTPDRSQESNADGSPSAGIPDGSQAATDSLVAGVTQENGSSVSAPASGTPSDDASISTVSVTADRTTEDATTDAAITDTTADDATARV